MGKKVRDSLRSRKPTRDPYPRVLIVCEGKKTEPNYFKGLRKHLRLRRDSVKIAEECGTPIEIVKQAQKRYDEEEKENKRGGPYDKVFCVFDKDKHPGYEDAKRMLKSKDNFKAIYSVPCFEYWLLLHYEYTTKPDVADGVLSRLRQRFPKYNKNDRDIFERFSDQDKLEYAKGNAVKSLKDARSADTDNPSTKVHILVSYLQNIKKR